MSTTLNIHADLLQDTGSISYKYGVHCFMPDNVTLELEVLHGAPQKVHHLVSRCLIIPKLLFRRGGMRCIHGNILLTGVCVY